MQGTDTGNINYTENGTVYVPVNVRPQKHGNPER